MLDHYLEVLAFKPGALPGATALAAARASGAFTPTHDRFWVAARRKAGDREGTRALIDVLLAHRTLPAVAMIGDSTAACSQAGQELEVRTSVQPTPNPNFRRVDAVVTGWIDGNLVNLLTISTIMGRY